MLKLSNILNKLYKDLPFDEFDLEFLLKNIDKSLFDEILKMSKEIKEKYYSNKIYLRALLEFSNICQRDCLYCGIRNSNKNAIRYRLRFEDIYKYSKQAYDYGFRTLVLQGGEDSYFTDDRLIKIIKTLKNDFDGTAITLSIGERSYESYKMLKQAGVDRFLLRHETADEKLYLKLHPNSSFKSRKESLYNLKKLNYQTGTGFIVGLPEQNEKTLAKDLMFIHKLKPQMVGVGPFISHKFTPLKDVENGSVDTTILMYGIIRIMEKSVLLPVTTALSTIAPDKKILALKHSCNVIMPNITPSDKRKKYEIYENKNGEVCENFKDIEILRNTLKENSLEIDMKRGDYKNVY